MELQTFETVLKTKQGSIICGKLYIRSIQKSPNYDICFISKNGAFGVMEFYKDMWYVNFRNAELKNENINIDKSYALIAINPNDYDKISQLQRINDEEFARQREFCLGAKIIGAEFSYGCDTQDTFYFHYEDGFDACCSSARDERWRKDRELKDKCCRYIVRLGAEEVKKYATEILPSTNTSYWGARFDEAGIQKILLTVQQIDKGEKLKELAVLKKNLQKEKLFFENASDKAIFENFFVKKVKIDEEGYFSACDDCCDDCVDMSYIARDVFDGNSDILQQAEKFFVKSKKGKTYTYYEASDKIKDLFVDRMREDLQKLRAKTVSEISLKIEQVEKEENEINSQIQITETSNGMSI